MTYSLPASRAWRGRGREPGLSVLLVLELLVMFVVLPLDEMGILTHWLTDAAIVLAILAASLVVSRHRVAVVAIIASAALAGWTSWMRGHAPTTVNISLQFLAIMIYIATLMLVVGAAVFAPGRVTVHRVQGAVVLYVKLAMFFAYADRLLAVLIPGSYSPVDGPGAITEGTRALYFSLITLTSTGYGDIVPLHPLARSLANLEALIGQLFPATLLARLVTLELDARKQ